MRRHRSAILVLLALLFVGNLVNAVKKGGDFDVFVEGGRRVLASAPLYAGSGPGNGVIGPPFQSVFFVPFALVAGRSVVGAKLLWHLAGCLALVVGVWWWAAALRSRRADGGPKGVISTSVLLAFLAILLPLQTNFEHQNLNPLLLAILGGAALAIRRDRSLLGAALVGLATALKAFPGLMIVYLLAARRWLAALVAAITAVALTLATSLFYGWRGAVSLFDGWLAVNRGGGWPIRGNNQSLFAMFGRYFGHDGIAASGQLYPALDPVPYWLAAVVAMLLVIVFVVVVARSRPDSALAPAQMAGALVLSVVISPIAWEHYWVLMFPAFAVLHASANRRSTRIAFWASAILTSAFSRATVGASGLALARGLSAWTVAGLVLFVALLAICVLPASEAASGTPCPSGAPRSA